MDFITSMSASGDLDSLWAIALIEENRRNIGFDVLFVKCALKSPVHTEWSNTALSQLGRSDHSSDIRGRPSIGLDK
jgi:hypothetical protein